LSSPVVLQVELREKRVETPDVRSFIFALDRDLSYSPGQYLVMDLGVAEDPKGRIRPFSIASSPTEKGLLMISTRVTSRLASSLFKKRLNELEPGSKVNIRAPFGRFLLPADTSKGAVMLSGGIGITPLRSMIKYATDLRPDLGITLLYSNRVPEDIPFRKELTELAEQNPRLKIIHTITHPRDSRERWTGLTSRIDERLVKHHITDVFNTIFYVSGPPGMVDSMLVILKKMNVRSQSVMSESFAGYE
jgi:ferredoxin-NADP reductase